MDTKNKLPQSREEAYTRYDDGRFTLYMRIEDYSHKRYIKEGKDLVVSYNGSCATAIGPLNMEDLKALRKLIRKAIRNYESNEQFQV